MTRKRSIQHLRSKLYALILGIFCFVFFFLIPPVNIFIVFAGIMLISFSLSVGVYLIFGDIRVSFVVFLACLFTFLLSAFDMLDKVTFIILTAFLVMLGSILFSKDIASQ